MNHPLTNITDHYVLALVDDLFFTAKIKEAARHAGLSLVTVRHADQASPYINERQPAVIILDLDALNCEPISLIKRLIEDELMREIPAIGFVAHVNTSRQNEARMAGLKRVFVRSVFSRDLPQILAEFAKTELPPELSPESP